MAHRKPHRLNFRASDETLRAFDALGARYGTRARAFDALVAGETVRLVELAKIALAAAEARARRAEQKRCEVEARERGKNHRLELRGHQTRELLARRLSLVERQIELARVQRGAEGCAESPPMRDQEH